MSVFEQHIADWEKKQTEFSRKDLTPAYLAQAEAHHAYEDAIGGIDTWPPPLGWASTVGLLRYWRLILNRYRDTPGAEQVVSLAVDRIKKIMRGETWSI